MLFLRLLRPWCHFLILCIIFYSIYNLRIATDWIPFIYLNVPYINAFETLLFWLISSILFLLFWFTFSLYKLKWPIHNYYNKFLKIFIFWFVTITFVAYFWHWYIFKDGISRLIIIWSGFFSFFGLLILDFFLNLINSKIESKKPYKVWVLKGRYFKNIKEKFKNYDIYNLKEFSKNEEINNFDIIFLIWNIESKKIEEIMDIARLLQIEVYHIPDVNFLEDILYFSERIGPTIAWKYKASPLEWRWRVFKRIFDICFSLGFIILFFWVYILVALRIYLNDRWKIFYISERIWQWWKKIKIYKFRTMVKNAEKMKEKLKKKNERKWALFKIKDDPRIPRWWKILRKTSLDEIPQFFNVLMWNMSIAWPRPHLQDEVDKYEHWQKRLLAAKPWITGYAQVFGRDLEFSEEAKLDLYRFQNWSIWMDIIVILWVFRTILKWK